MRQDPASNREASDAAQAGGARAAGRFSEEPPEKMQKTLHVVYHAAWPVPSAAAEAPPLLAVAAPLPHRMRVVPNGSPGDYRSKLRNPWKRNLLPQRSVPAPAVCHLVVAAATIPRAAAELVRPTAPHAVPHFRQIADCAQSGFGGERLPHCIAELYAQASYMRAFQNNQRQLVASLPRRPSMSPLAACNVAGTNIILQRLQRLKLIGLGNVCVLLAMRLLCDGSCCPMKYPLAHASRLLSQRHVMPFFLLPTPIARLQAHNFNCLSVAFHPLLQLMATGSHDRSAKLWHLDENTQSVTLTATLVGHTDWVWCVAFHSSLPLLATSSRDFTAKLWVISDDLTAVCSATLRGHSSWVCSVVFHPIFPFLATGGNDGYAKLWSFETDGTVSNDGMCTGSVYAHSSIVISVALHPNLFILATGGDNNVLLWKFDSSGKNLKRFASLEGHNDWVWCVAFHPKLPLLASGSEDGTVQLWLIDSEMATVSCSARLEGHDAGVNTVAFNPNLPMLATGSGDGTVKLWLLRSDGKIANCSSTLKGQGDSVSSAAFHPHIPLLATGIRDGTVHLWR